MSLASKQRTNGEIAQQLEINKTNVAPWRNRYLEEGFDTLLKDWPSALLIVVKNSEAQIEFGNCVFRTAAKQVKYLRAKYHPQFQIRINNPSICSWTG